MEEREKIIRGLTHHSHGRCEINGQICPYFSIGYCSQNMCIDALALLKAEGPRVIRAEEYEGWTEDAWAEDRETGHVTALDRSVVQHFMRLMAREDSFEARLWTGRPTEEQRLAEPWE